uniref:Cupin type-1 domain-containing protein n=2 Tax=Setaria italica TaxID=4555 RepID=K3ZD60_SETIT
MAPTSCLRTGFFFLQLLLLGHGSMAIELQAERISGLSFAQVAPAAASASASSSSSCEFAFDRLRPLDPLPEVIRAEAGTLQYFDDPNQQLTCAGVFFVRIVVDDRGLVLPRFNNGGTLIFTVQGRGVVGVTIPECGGEKRYRFAQHDVIAVPPGVPAWIYNDGGNGPLEIVVLFTISGKANQLEPQHRDFSLAGSNGNRSKNIFNGFAVESLSRSLRISQYLATILQGQMDQRGTIVRVPAGLLQLQPKNNLNATMAVQFQGSEEQEEDVQDEAGDMCRMKVTKKLEEKVLTGYEFPILNSVGLSIERGTYKPNTISSPFYTIKAQIVAYLTRGSARVQVVDNRGVAVFDGVLRRGQPLVVPQYYVVIVEAGKDGFEFIAFKTNANPVISYIAGRVSVLHDLSVDVIAAAYNISKYEAERIKDGRRWAAL